MDNIKFYGINEKTIKIPKINNDNYDVKENNFDKALKSVVQKDITPLNEKLTKIQEDVTKKLVISGMMLNQKLNYTINNVDDFISELENYISNLIIEKGSIKIGFLSPNKKEKKNKIRILEDTIDCLNKYQSELLTLKKEYSKLIERDKKIENVEFSSEIIDSRESSEDPLERTISFYMKKQEEKE